MSMDYPGLVPSDRPAGLEALPAELLLHICQLACNPGLFNVSKRVRDSKAFIENCKTLAIQAMLPLSKHSESRESGIPDSSERGPQEVSNASERHTR